MHGVIFNQLYKFLRKNHGNEVLESIFKDSGLSADFINTQKIYPESELIAFIRLISKLLNVNEYVIMESFGMSLTPALLKIFRSHINLYKNSLDLLQSIDATHSNFFKKLGMEIDIIRRENNVLELKFPAEKRMISIEIGMLKALIKYFGEAIVLQKESSSNGVFIYLVRI